jgi:carbamoyltransferase
MKVLGYNGGLDGYPSLFNTGHDAAAALVIDGRVIAAAEEERFSREKHSGKFPEQAIAYCLREAGLRSVEELDLVTYYFSYPLMFAAQKLHSNAPHLNGIERVALGTFLGAMRAVNRYGGYDDRRSQRFFEQKLGVTLDEQRYRVVPHHLCHAASAFYDSPFSQALCLTLDAEGESSSCLALQASGTDPRSLPRALGPARRSEEPVVQRHMDIAAALQEAMERVVLRHLAQLRRATGERNLCLAGGVALNCSMNGKIARSGLFDHIYIHPAAHDAGTSVGAALYGYHNLLGQPRAVAPRQSVFLGPAYELDSVASALKLYDAQIRHSRPEDLYEQVAQAIADGKVVGWYRGRMEWGPRALGNRSILADVRRDDMKDIVNHAVKMREGFRPFAPACLHEHAADWFDMSGLSGESPHMLFVVPVHEDKQSAIPAVTHVDGSARVQTVTAADNAPFHTLLTAFHRLTGVPLVLNTSFNVKGEPIVNTPADAIRCFLNTGIDLLVLDSCVVEKRQAQADARQGATSPLDSGRVRGGSIAGAGAVAGPQIKSAPRKKYYKVKFGDLVINYLPELDGGGMTFGRQYLDVVARKLGHVGHLFEYCSGPGFIGFALLASGLCDRLTLADVNPAAVDCCRQTVRDNRLEHCVSVYQSDCLDDIPPDERWDLVVSNPPHWPGSAQEYRDNLRLIDPEFIVHRKFYRDVRHFLAEDGSIIFQENGHATRREHFVPMIEEGGLQVIETFSERESRQPKGAPLQVSELQRAFFHRVLAPVERLLTNPRVERLVKDNDLYRAASRLPIFTPSPYYFIWSKRVQAHVAARVGFSEPSQRPTS